MGSPVRWTKYKYDYVRLQSKILQCGLVHNRSLIPALHKIIWNLIPFQCTSITNWNCTKTRCRFAFKIYIYIYTLYYTRAVKNVCRFLNGKIDQSNKYDIIMSHICCMETFAKQILFRIFFLQAIWVYLFMLL